MKIKVCGMRDSENVHQAVLAGADMIGFIFYQRSSRAVDNDQVIPTLNQVKRVGVFVNEDPKVILSLVKKWSLDIVQLHGDETPEDCSHIRRNGIVVTKAFSIGPGYDFGQVEDYESVVDYFLFDTKGQYYGGNGEVFDWDLLETYQASVPFWLSGGIHPALAMKVKALRHPALFAIDINSGFEVEPGLKNIARINRFIDEIQG